MHYYLHLNLSGMFLRSHSVCGMLISSLTGNRIRCIPRLLYCCYAIYYYNHIFADLFKYLKSNTCLCYFVQLVHGWGVAH